MLNVPGGVELPFVPLLTLVLERFRAERLPGETFGDSCQRQGQERGG